MAKLLLIDGSSLLHRAFYALPLLSTADGIYTNAVHGFMMMFNKLTALQKPDYIAVCFDKSRVSFRNRIDPDYKGTRSETPLELRGQFELIKEVLDAGHIKWLELADYEADDLLGTLSAWGSEQGMRVEIFSGDRDVFQLIDERTHVFMTKKGISDIEHYDAAAIRDKYQVEPGQLIDVKALMGDSSDNIPGVPGVGEKTAVKLISRFGSLEQLYADVAQVEGQKLREKLLEYQDQAFRCRELATINREAPLDAAWEDYAYNPNQDQSRLAALYRKLGFRQLSRNLPQQPELLSQPPEQFREEAARPWPTGEESPAAPAETPPLCPVESICDPAQASAYAALIKQAGGCALSALWQGFPAEGRLEYLALYAPEQTPLLLDLREDRQPLQELQAVLEDAGIAKLTGESKELYELLAARGIALAGVTDDAVLAAYLLDPAAGDYPLSELARGYGLAYAPEQGPATAVAAARLLPELLARQREKLAAAAMIRLYEELELPLARVLAEMERAGIRVEAAGLAEMSRELAASAEEYQRQIYALAGHAFNLNSTKQLGVVLFEEMGIPPLKKTKTGYSTDAEVLETLAQTQPIARLLLDYRLAAKLRSTYTDGMSKLIDPRDRKLHTTFKQTVAATGRLSSVEPNLQNIPIRHELGRRIRRVFVADQPGDLLLAADYNQIELRILAHISGDPGLVDSFLKGEDIHTRTAAEVLGLLPEQITPFQRRQAKAVNFGIVYGISDYGLSRDLGISRAEAGEYIRRYFARYPKVSAYQQQTILSARKTGYVETMYGRRRYLPDLLNRNFNLRSFAERMAINAPIQGSAADIIKLAMIRIAAEIRARGLRSRMLLQVHDELIFNMAPEERELLPALVRENMEQAAALAVPLTVDVKAGPNWYEMEKINA